MRHIFARVSCCPKTRTNWLFGCGGFGIALAVIIGLTWAAITKLILQHEFQLRDGSQLHKNWMVTPIPMYVQFRMFNWTNSDDVQQPNYKPNVVEMGPYVFLEKHERVNVSFHPENDTVTFDQIRTWHFMPDMSNGTLDDYVTNVDTIAVTTAHTLRNMLDFVKFGVNQLMKLLNRKVVVTKTVRELLFDGYDDSLLKIVKTIPLISKPPFEKFGWFVDRNSSWKYDGHFEMRSGQTDLSQMGHLTKWNYANKTRYFRGACNEVTGTTGEIWPMGLSATDDITMFITDLCRPITLAYQKEHTMFGMKASKWIGDHRVFDNGIKYPPNNCYGTRQSFPTLKTGVQDMSSCRYGAPAFASYPHFYLADKSYVNAVTGLNPNRKEHEFSLVIEPTTGIPLHVDAKIQINMLIQPIRGFSLFENVSRVMVPVLWFSQNVEITDDLALQAKIAVELPSFGFYIACGLSSLSIILLVFGIIRIRNKSASIMKTPI